MIALNKAMCLAVAWNVHCSSYPVYAETARWRWRGRCYKSRVSFPYKSAKEIQSPHPGLKIGSKSQQIPCRAPHMSPGWPLISS